MTPSMIARTILDLNIKIRQPTVHKRKSSEPEFDSAEIKSIWNRHRKQLLQYYMHYDFGTGDSTVVKCSQVDNPTLLLCLYDCMRTEMKSQHQRVSNLEGDWEPIGSQSCCGQWDMLMQEMRGSMPESVFYVTLVNNVPVAFMSGLKEQTRKYYHARTDQTPEVVKCDNALYLRYIFKHPTNSFVRTLKVTEQLFKQFSASGAYDFIYLHYQKCHSALGLYYTKTLGFEPVDSSSSRKGSLEDLISISFADESPNATYCASSYLSIDTVPMIVQKALDYQLLTSMLNCDAIMIYRVATTNLAHPVVTANALLICNSCGLQLRAA